MTSPTPHVTTDHLKPDLDDADTSIVGTPSRTTPEAESPDDRAIETADDLVALVRRRGLTCDSAIVDRIDRAIGATHDDHDLGKLYIARALALQGRGSAAAPAAAVRNAIPHLLAVDAVQTAAFASAMAAVFVDQTDEPIAAIDHAVDALVMLGNARTSTSPLGLEGVRASLALSGYFMRISAFDLAVDAAGRAFRSAHTFEGVPIDPLVYSVGYVSIEGAHVAEDPTVRDRYVAQAGDTIDWLESHGIDNVSRILMANGLRAETRHALGLDSDDLGLDASTAFYDTAAPDIVAWHQMVRAASALARAELDAAIELFGRAIPGLEASADNHCLVRALRGRAEAHAAAGDFESAYADSADLARRTRRWQISQVGRLAFQLARRADLERSTTELRHTVERLADDIDNDATTGVNSRRWLDRRLDELALTDGFGSVLMCDIDRFKSVNDSYGHHVGDDVLLELGGLFHEVAPDADIARFGGEEFVIVLIGADETTGSKTAERLRLTVEQHDWEHVAPGLHLTISCGVAHGTLGEVRAQLVAADEALLDAKRGGRNLVCTPLGTAAR